MAVSVRRSFVYGLLIAGVILACLIPNHNEISSALARNAGFISLNHAKATTTGFDNETIVLKGIEFLELATVDDPNSLTAWRGLGFLYLMRGEEEKALRAWRQSRIMQTELLTRGTLARYAGDLDDALRWFQRAVHVDPTKPEGWLQTGFVYELRGESSDAMAIYKAGSQSIPDNSDLPFRLARLISRKPEPIDWESVLDLTDHAITLDNFLFVWNETQSHVLRADSLRQLGREADALDEYERVVGQYPDEYWATLRYGELTWQVENDLDKSVKLLERAIRLDSASKWAYRALGLVYDAAGQHDQAAGLFNIVLSIDPDDQIAQAWFKQHQ